MQLSKPLTMEQVDHLHTAMACMERAARLFDAANQAIAAVGIDMSPVSVTGVAQKYHEISDVLEQQRMMVNRARALSGLAAKRKAA